MTVNCPACGRFLKWHSSGDPDADDYKEWYTCACDGIVCEQGYSSVSIRCKDDYPMERRRFRSCT